MKFSFCGDNKFTVQSDYSSTIESYPLAAIDCFLEEVSIITEFLENLEKI